MRQLEQGEKGWGADLQGRLASLACLGFLALEWARSAVGQLVHGGTCLLLLLLLL